MMTCVVLSAHVPNTVGGVSDYTAHLSEALARQGYAMTVMTSTGQDILPVRGVRVRPIIRRWNVTAIPQLLTSVADEGADVVLLQYVPYLYNRWGVPFFLVLLALLLRSRRTPLVTTFHEVATRFERRHPKYWAIALSQRLIAFALGRCSSVSIVSTSAFAQMLRPWARNILRTPIGANIPPVVMTEQERQEHRNAFAEPDTTLIATFFSEDQQRRLDLVLRAVNHLQMSRGLRATVLILGETYGLQRPEGRKLTRLIHDLGMEREIRVTGYLPREELSRALASADVVVLLDDSTRGGTSARSGTLAAAWAAGLPVIGNRGPHTDDLLRHGENTFLIDELTREALASALETVLTDGALRARLGAGSAQTYQESIAWETIAEQYAQIFERISMHMRRSKNLGLPQEGNPRGPTTVG